MDRRWTGVMFLGMSAWLAGPSPSVRAQAIPPPATPPIVRALEDQATAGRTGGSAAPSGQTAATSGPGAGRPESGAAGGARDQGSAGASGASGDGPPRGAAAGASGPDFGAAAESLGPGFGASLEAAIATPFAMIGDMSPISIRGFLARTNAGVPPPVPTPGPPHPPGPRAGSPVYATVRGVKITDNMSPRPMDRVFFDFNYYNNLNDALNRRDLSPITQMKAYTYLFGFEKTFNDGLGSIGLRVPLENLTANSVGNSVSTPTTTAPGDMSLFAKYILAQNTRTGSLVSAGFAVTLPTGPGKFAGAPYLFGINSIYFQPFVGYIYNYNRWYFQGFTGMSFAANVNDVSIIYNDVGIGYFIKRSTDPREFISAIAPSFEVHVNDPMNHRDVFNRFDIAGSADVLDLTFGLNVEIHRAAVISFAFVTPLTSPKPFDSEALILLNYYYGRSRGGRIPITPPPAL